MFSSKVFSIQKCFSSPLMHFPAEVLLRVGISLGERYQLQSVALNDAAWEQKGIPLTALRRVCCPWYGLNHGPDPVACVCRAQVPCSCVESLSGSEEDLASVRASSPAVDLLL